MSPMRGSTRCVSDPGAYTGRIPHGSVRAPIACSKCPLPLPCPALSRGARADDMRPRRKPRGPRKSGKAGQHECRATQRERRCVRNGASDPNESSAPWAAPFLSPPLAPLRRTPRARSARPVERGLSSAWTRPARQSLAAHSARGAPHASNEMHNTKITRRGHKRTSRATAIAGPRAGPWRRGAGARGSGGARGEGRRGGGGCRARRETSGRSRGGRRGDRGGEAARGGHRTGLGTVRDSERGVGRPFAAWIAERGRAPGRARPAGPRIRFEIRERALTQGPRPRSP